MVGATTFATRVGRHRTAVISDRPLLDGTLECMRTRSSIERPPKPEYLHPLLVSSLIGRTLEQPEADELAGVFSLFADPTRLRILHALGLADEVCVYDLALVLGISQSALSHQLALLRNQHTVARRKEGRLAYYRLSSPSVRRALAAALDLGLPHATTAR
jgi:DNA-binding transcriptional ArsR family regulator